MAIRRCNTSVLEAQHLSQAQVRVQRPECRLRVLRWNPEPPVESQQELLQHAVDFPDAAPPCQPQFGYEAVLESFRHPLHSSLRLGREGEYHLDPQLVHGPAELGWPLGEAGAGRVLEDPVPVGVQGEGYAAALQEALDQQEVAVGLLHLAEEGVNDCTGGIVYCDQQRERWHPVPQPRVMTAVHLDQHFLPGHSLVAYPVLGLAPALRTAEPGVDLDTPQGGPADVDAVALAQQLAEMGVVGPCVPGVSQVNHSGCNGLGSCAGRLAATETVSNGGSVFLLVSRKDTPGVSRADTHQCSGLIQRHVLCQQAVQSPESRLFFGSQSHILHELNVTFLLAS